MKKKVIYVVATLVVVVAVAFNVKTVLDSNHAYDLTMASIDALSESGGQESNNEGSEPFYNYLQGQPEKCTVYKHISPAGDVVYSTNGAALGSGWTTEKIVGFENKCSNYGTGCTPYSCRTLN